MLNIKELSELKVLFNVMYALKFNIDDDELSRLIRSPIFSEIFNKVLVEMLDGYKNIQAIHQEEENNWRIENRPNEREKIKEYLFDMEFWEDLDQSTKDEIVKILLSPFFYNESSAVKLKKETDDFHKR